MSDFLSNKYSPFRFRELSNHILVTNEIGDFDVFPTDILERFFNDQLTNDEVNQFKNLSIIFDNDSKWRLSSLLRRVRKETESTQRKINYIMLIPTLRCDLSCSYCQVSRAPVNSKGFDWTDSHLAKFESFIEQLELDHVKIEFQGGEPTLRTDLLKKIIQITEKHSTSSEFVVCSNLTTITPEIEELYERDDLVISTSIDGSISTMTENRTSSDDISQQIFNNFQYILKKYGPSKISALPTITEAQIDNPKQLLDIYVDLGFQSIFLRPVNYMGFARKQHRTLSQQVERWNNFYTRSLDLIKDINKTQYFDEFYTSLVIRKIFSKEPNGFVDFRSPSRFLNDTCVIDFDGEIYPSDEARMLSRIRHIDLSVGNLESGINEDKLSVLNDGGINQFHEDCIHCAYMPHCGIDIIDDISRYKRFDVIKQETWFCNKQLFLFDFIFSKVITKDKEWLDLFLRWMKRSTTPSNAYDLFL